MYNSKEQPGMQDLTITWSGTNVQHFIDIISFK